MRYKLANLFFFVLFLTVSMPLDAQITQRFPIELKWLGVMQEQYDGDTINYIALESGCYDGPVPVFVQSFPIFDGAVKVEAVLQDVKTVTLSVEESQIAKRFAYGTDFVVESVALQSRDDASLSLRIVPFRQVGEGLEKLVSATLLARITPDSGAAKTTHSYAQQSAMATGDWYKIGLPETGVYKLTYSDLNGLGINISGIDPRTIRIYHNGGGVLPELNTEARLDDLVEIPIFVSGESDGSFDQNDYILFYGRGPVVWKYNAENQAFEHVQNPYDDYSYAFVVTGKGNGKRIDVTASPSGNANVVVTEFIDYQVHESDDNNYNRTGRTYYGDRMDGNVSKSFDFSFPNVVASKPCSVKTALAGRNFSPASFDILVDNVQKANYPIQTTVNSSQYPYGYDVGGWVSAVPSRETVRVTLKHNANSTSSLGLVDYVLVNAWRNLKMVGGQMAFRNPEATNINNVYEYRLSDASQQLEVWNVTEPTAPSRVNAQLNGSVLSFKVNGAPDNSFVAFNGSSFCSAKALGKVDNQNLHGVRDVDYVILTYSDFISQAERLKGIHERIDPELNVFVTTPELIYNEFSCGAKDVSAIRDFCRMLYLDSGSGRKIKYLLLLGDCSYDYKNRDGVVDFVPAFETVASLNMNTTFVTDDFYGFMDENEGNINNSLSDIGIGRFPVSTLEQATQMVDKVERYLAKNENTMQPWRNVVTFFNDDESQFMSTTEGLEAMLKNVNGEGAVVDKLYLGAYQQQSSPSGEICPEINEAVNSRMEKGTAVLVYIGHGGEVQLADERILQRKDVDSWRNGPKYPLMITGTCEFSRYDDHERTSLGEYSFLNQYGGMIAMFTTSRITYGPDNEKFCQGAFNNLFRISGGEHYRLGDVYRMAKTRGVKEEKRYVFFGDPALHFSYPKLKVETLSINGKSPVVWNDSIQSANGSWTYAAMYQDTIRALQPVEIEGVVKDFDGQVASGFNGVVNVTVYDKESNLVSRCVNSNNSVTNVPFKLRNSVIFNGKTEVRNGRFKIAFIVPRDISYRFGEGLINYYATDYDVDANGNCTDFIIGGFYDDATLDEEPPAIRLFIDDTLFVSGGITGQNPTMLAFVEDESGINTTGAGIGHDIMASLTGGSRNAYCLNDYFVSEIDNPGKGQIAFKMQNLAAGDYTLTLKVWDIYNNSNTASIDFTVVNSGEMAIEDPVNYPNPVIDETCFTFEHNQVGSNLKVQIDIFDIMGRWVTRLSETIEGTSARTSPVRWDGCGANGERLRNGVYVYRILATNDSGETAAVVSKLVLNK